jgi:hypothetical protein
LFALAAWLRHQLEQAEAATDPSLMDTKCDDLANGSGRAQASRVV